MAKKQDNTLITLQIQVEIEPNKLNDIYAQRHHYISKHGKIKQKNFLGKILSIGYDNMNIYLNKKN